MQLENGQGSTVKNLDAVEQSLRMRLNSIGVMPGCKLCVRQASFLNGPCILECRGQRICIRKAEAQKIEVQVS
ncbi:FeoA family protein [Lentibacillus cibarius]|nr:FeoA family protein [Lentibacillus cibarius]